MKDHQAITEGEGLFKTTPPYTHPESNKNLRGLKVAQDGQDGLKTATLDILGPSLALWAPS